MAGSRIVVAALIVFLSYVSRSAPYSFKIECDEPARMDPVTTVPGELDCLAKSTHIQGACCTERGVYLSHATGIIMTGWDGRVVRQIEEPCHLGDIAHANGRIYGAFGFSGDRLPNGGRKGLVRVWDDDLNKIDEAWFDDKLDGIAVLGDTIYVGVDRYGHPAHPMCRVKRLGLDLSDKGDVDVDLGFSMHYGVQTMATDGKSLVFGCYSAGRDEGNPEGFCGAVLSSDLKVERPVRLGIAEGFDLVPKSVSKRDAPVFLAVRALNGNMAAWRKDPVKNPPRLRLDFFEYENGRFTPLSTARTSQGKADVQVAR